MKRKFIFTLLSLVCAIACAFGLAACGSPDDVGNNGEEGGENNPPIELKESDAPIDILFQGANTTAIYVAYAIYGNDKTPSPYSEYKLDDGEWIAAQTGDECQAVYENLTPGSTHTVYARCGAHDEYKASAEYSVTITLNKEYNHNKIETLKYDVTAKTLTVKLEEGMEVSFDNDETYSTDGTHTYNETGEKSFRVRYAETATHYSGDSKRYSVVITDFDGGLGTEENPYRIDTLEQFKTLRNATYLQENNWLKLTSDIVFDDETWGESWKWNEYTLNIDGNGHKIVNPNLSTPLFNNLGTAKNLTVENVKCNTFINGNETRAALLSNWIHQADNVSVCGSITVACGEKPTYFRDHCVSVGGIAVSLKQPYTGGTYGMSDCRVNVTVSLPDTTEWSGWHAKYNLALGGLAAAVSRSGGTDSATISACAVNLSVSGGVIYYGDIGGLVGGPVASSESGSSNREAPPIAVCDCYTTGNVSLKVFCGMISGSKQVTRIGGIAPAVRGSIERCYSTIEFDIDAEISRNSSVDDQAEVRIGGIVAVGAHEGIKYPTLSNVFFAGKILAKNKDGTNDIPCLITGATCVQPADFDTPSKWYFDAAVLTVTEGYETITASAMETKVATDELKSVNWQKNNLGWDETVWTLTNGKLPDLK